MDRAGIQRIYFFAVLALQLIAYPIAVFNIGKYDDPIYFAIIFSCFITSLVFIKKNAQSLLQVGALLFTCIADCYLILGFGEELTGVCFFLVTQLFYAARTLLLAKGKVEFILNLSIRALLSAFALLIAIGLLGDGAEPLFIVSLIYYANLLVNIAFAFVHFKENKLLAIGLTLFALCDTVIGLEEMVDLFVVAKESWFYILMKAPYALEGIFYCPSQVLLSVSAVHFHKNKGRECEKITKEIL